MTMTKHQNPPANELTTLSLKGDRGARLCVIHSVPGSWIESTQTWLYNQVRFLPETVESHVVCPMTQNLDRFGVANLHAEADQHRLRRVVDSLSRQLRLRRHTSLLERVARESGEPGGAKVLHSHFGPTGWESLRVTRKLGLKHVVTFYGLDVNFLPRVGWKNRYQELFEQVDGVLCEGPHMARCISDLGCSPEKVHVHHLGIDVDSITFAPKAWSGDEPLRILIAASFREKKGIPYALEAISRLRRDVDCEVTIIGDASDSNSSRSEKQRILETIDRLELRSCLRMLGFQSYQRLMEEAKHHHVFCSPSVTASNGDTEGGAPVSLLDMKASGLMIVGTNHCDIPEIVRDDETGWLADERDIEGLENCFRRMIDQHQQWNKIARRGRDDIEARFNARVQGERLASIYSNLVEEKKALSDQAGNEDGGAEGTRDVETSSLLIHPMVEKSLVKPVSVRPIRRSLMHRLSERGGRLTRSFVWRRRLQSFGRGSVIARPAWVVGGEAIRIGDEVTIWRHARLEALNTARNVTRIDIGDGTVIQPYVHIGAIESVHIGRGVLMASQVYVTDHDHDFRNLQEPVIENSRVLAAPVSIGDYVWLGERVMVLKGVTIGAHAVIGAGSIVTRDIPVGTIAVGTPARVIRRYDERACEWRSAA